MVMIRVFPLILLAALLAVIAVDRPPPGDEEDKPSKKRSRAVTSAEFLAAPIGRIDIEIPPDSVRSLDRENRTYVPCTVRMGDEVYESVGVHLKGAAGSFQPLRGNPGLTLNFKKFGKGGCFHGMTKIHLNNSVQDPSFMTEIICGDLFRAAGVPAASAGHARVFLNGRDLGLHVLVEGMDEAYLKRFFQRKDGNLYDGGFLHEIDQPLRRLRGKGSDDQREIRALVAAAREEDPGKRWEMLVKCLDMDRFISFLALETIVWDWDGYPMKMNNYRVYLDPGTKLLTFMPHGMDQMFQDPGGALFPQMQGMVASAVLRTTEGRRRYVERLTQLSKEVFKVEAILEGIRGPAGRIRAAMADKAHFLERHARAMENLEARMRERARSIASQIGSLPKPPRFDEAGRASLSGWEPKDPPGSAQLETSEDPDGRSVLRIRVKSGARSTTSWRARVLLEPGRYRFEGRARAAGVVPLADLKGGGAGIRVHGSKSPRENALSGSSDWTALEYDFEVKGVDDVELVCELRASAGEAQFEAGSLRLTKLK
jgi:spore coat protein CotH